MRLPQRTTGNQGMSKQEVFPREEHAIGYLIPVVSPESIHANNTIQTEQGVYSSLGIYMYIHTYM